MYLDQYSPCFELVYTDKYHFWHRRASRDKFIDMFIGFCISLIDVNSNGAFDKLRRVYYFINWSNFKLRCGKNGINSSHFFIEIVLLHTYYMTIFILFLCCKYMFIVFPAYLLIKYFYCVYRKIEYLWLSYSSH